MSFPAPGASSLARPSFSDFIALLRPYIARRVPHDDVEDLLQETMLRLHQRKSIEMIENPSAYAFQTARSVMVDRGRRDAVRQRNAHAELEEAHHPIEYATPERVLAGRQALDRLTCALSEMPVRTRDVFVLHRFEEMSYAEIGAHLGISLSAVGKHMMKALCFLAQRGLP